MERVVKFSHLNMIMIIKVKNVSDDFLKLFQLIRLYFSMLLGIWFRCEASCLRHKESDFSRIRVGM